MARRWAASRVRVNIERRATRMETKVALSLVIIFLQPLSWNTSTRRRAFYFWVAKHHAHATIISVEVWTRVTYIASVRVANLTTVYSVSTEGMEETQSRPVMNSEV